MDISAAAITRFDAGKISIHIEIQAKRNPDDIRI